MPPKQLAFEGINTNTNFEFQTSISTSRNERLPLCIGGDFNIIQDSSEKNNDKFDGRWLFLSNAVIDSLDLREIEMSDHKFTWANSRRVPTYEKLDRVLVSIEWEQNFPLATVQALIRKISDHTPLLLSVGSKNKGTNQPPFKFEMGWLLGWFLAGFRGFEKRK
jgi:endonuclease/exonuclease/phosphatase family metal-dependent hydrolase